MGIVRMRPGESEPAHRHPNCEEAIHVLEGDIEHWIEGRSLLSAAPICCLCY